MSTPAVPISRSLRPIRRQKLAQCRFLGLHQLWFALLGTPPITYGLALMFDPTGWWLVLVGFSLAWLSVEVAFLPRRLAARRLAVWECQDEGCREALRRGVSRADMAGSGGYSPGGQRWIARLSRWR